MFPSIESRLPFEGLICRAREIFPVAGSASDDHHNLVLFQQPGNQLAEG